MKTSKNILKEIQLCWKYADNTNETMIQHIMYLLKQYEIQLKNERLQDYRDEIND